MKLKSMYLSFYITSILSTLAVGAMGYWAINKINDNLDALAMAGDAQVASRDADMMHDALRSDIFAINLAAEAADSAALQKATEDVASHSKRYLDRMDLVAKLGASEQLNERLKTLNPKIDAYILSATEIVNIANDQSNNVEMAPTENALQKNKSIIKTDNKTQQAAIKKALPMFLDLFSELEVDMGDLGTLVKSSSAARRGIVTLTSKRTKTAIVVGSVVTTTSLVLLAWFITRRRMVALGAEPEKVREIANTIASGDLSEEIPLNANDSTSLLASMQKMQYNLRALIWQIKTAADDIGTGAQEISAGNTNLSQRTEEQASSLEETASSMEEMASTVKQNAENAKQANVMATEASAVAVKGGEVVNQVISTMSEINTSSKKIVDIISVIDGIAFQTNILALNAAVEAARAGEQGRGFAVVAAEVRSLAQRSATAAKEIKQLISDSVEKVGGGTKQVQAAGETMEEIVMAVKMVSDIVNEITAASQEQSAGIDQVNNAITNMDEVVQQNAALVEQASAAASALEGKALELIDATEKFRLAEDNYISNNDARGNLNEVNAPQVAELPKTKQSRLKAPKVKKEEDWEEF